MILRFPFLGASAPKIPAVKPGIPFFTDEEKIGACWIALPGYRRDQYPHEKARHMALVAFETPTMFGETRLCVFRNAANYTKVTELGASIISEVWKDEGNWLKRSYRGFVFTLPEASVGGYGRLHEINYDRLRQSPFDLPKALDEVRGMPEALQSILEKSYEAPGFRAGPR